MSELNNIHKQRIYLRKKMRALRVKKALRSECEEGLAQAIMASNVLNTHQSIGIYYSVGHEVPTHHLIHSLSRKGYDISLPCMANDGMVFRTWSPGQQLDQNEGAIPQPFKAQALAHPSLLIVPLLAFDSRGHRLGYGKGFYDRYLSDNPSVRGIGLAFSFQELTLLPNLQHDVIIDHIAVVAPHATQIRTSI